MSRYIWLQKEPPGAWGRTRRFQPLRPRRRQCSENNHAQPSDVCCRGLRERPGANRASVVLRAGQAMKRPGIVRPSNVVGWLKKRQGAGDKSPRCAPISSIMRSEPHKLTFLPGPGMGSARAAQPARPAPRRPSPTRRASRSGRRLARAPPVRPMLPLAERTVG